MAVITSLALAFFASPVFFASLKVQGEGGCQGQECHKMTKIGE